MNFDQVLKAWDWKPIRNCPGRLILAGAPSLLSPDEVAGSDIQTTELRASSARDTVVVAEIEGGGLISYRRADGSWVHTLNTPEGFARKLAQLGALKSQI
jgi:hypothetical protein